MIQISLAILARLPVIAHGLILNHPHSSIQHNFKHIWYFTRDNELDIWEYHNVQVPTKGTMPFERPLM